MKEIITLTALLCLFGGCKEKDKAPELQHPPAVSEPAPAQTLPADPAQAAPPAQPAVASDVKPAAAPAAAAPSCDCKCGEKKSKKSKK